MKFSLRFLYLYLFSFIGLLMMVMGSVGLVNLAMKSLIFKEADKYEVYGPVVEKLDGERPLSVEELQERQDRDLKRQRERQLAESIAPILVGLPLYLYHWKTIQKESKNSKA